MFIVGNFGLYRSDNAGETWKHMDATDRRIMNGQGGYNCGVYVNSKNPDVVYVINTSSYISTDGGNTFTGFKGAPGGDDPQQMWIDPTDGNRLFLGTDQGSTVSLDGGQSWSSWYNQPTAQVYHISVDNQFPYWVYATQQDSGCIATSSRGNLGAVTPLDWLPHPGYEFGAIVADPLNSKVSYAGGPGGGIVKTTYPSGQWINVSPNMDGSLGLRRVGNQQLAFSATNPHELLAAFQFLMASTDGGMHWKKLGVDLTQQKGATPAKPAAAPARPTGTGGSGTQNSDPDEADDDDPDNADEQRGGGGGAIESFSVSSINGNVIWAGTNNGLVKVTKDHGNTWQDVTIPDLPNPTRADISAIDASHQDIGTAYLAIDYHNAGDFKPYLYRTRDFGKTWTKIVEGLPTDLPSGSFTRVIRADTRKAGLLFAGTESFVYVSFDDGGHWQSLALNLPNTSYRDMVVKDNDLVVGTYGRGFWVLDDISPLRQISASLGAAYLFQPGDAIRVRRNVNGDTPFPPEIPHALNPPASAIYFYLPMDSQGVTIDITDASGKLVRHMSSAPIPPSNDPPPPVPDFWVEKQQPLDSTAGMHRVSWNLRYDNPPAFNHSYEINANPGLTPASPEGPLVMPGSYTVTMTVNGQTYKQAITVRNDPRSPASAADLRAQHELQMKLYECARQAWDGYRQVAMMRASVADATKGNAAQEVADAAKDFDAKLTAIGGTAGFGRRFGGGGGGGGAAPAPTFARVVGALGGQLNTIDSGDMAPSEPLSKACLAACADLPKAEAAWKALNEKDLPAFNAILAKYNVKGIAAASNPSSMAIGGPSKTR